MTFPRRPSLESFEQFDGGEAPPPWQPMPGKRTLAQDLPLPTAEQRAREVAAMMAAIAAEGSGATRAVDEAHAVERAMPMPSHQVAARAGRGAGTSTSVIEDPFALHLMSERLP